MRILLTYKVTGAAVRDPFASLLPSGLGVMAACLKEAGYDARLANLSAMTWKECRAVLRDLQPRLLGISVFTHNRIASLRLAEIAKEIVPECFVLLGGPHAAPRSRQMLAHCRAVDGVATGEGESTILALARSLSSGMSGELLKVPGLVVRNGDVAASAISPPDLDLLPSPIEVITEGIGVDPRRQLEFLSTSRGCPAACRFCASPHFWGKRLRFHSPRRMVEDIRTIRDRFGLLYFSIRDDTFTADRERVRAFCQMLLDEKVFILWNCQSRVNFVDEEMLLWMKRAGCECVQFGIESGSPRVLDTLGKRITPAQIRTAAESVRRAGINLSVYLITGVPGEEEEDLRATVKLIEEIRPHDGQVAPLAYYPGTELFDTAVRNGIVSADLFEEERREGIYVREDDFTSRSIDRLLNCLSRVGDRCAFRSKDFESHKRVVGYCHATNILAGGYFESSGDTLRAEREYREIVEREPDNPWGWLLWGELKGRMGHGEEGLSGLERVRVLVPAHSPAVRAMGDLYRLAGSRAQARAAYREALLLDPYDRESDRSLAELA